MTPFAFFTRVLPACTLLGALAGCGRHTDPAPNGQVGLALAPNAAPAPVAGGGTLAFTGGYVLLRKAEFEGQPKAGGPKVMVEREQATTLDLATGAASPAFAWTIPPGVYTHVELELDLREDAGRPTVVAEGRYVPASGAAVPVRFEYSGSDGIKAEPDGEVTVQGAGSAFYVAFAPGRWFAPLTAAQLGGAQRVNGVIVLSKAVNPALYDQVVSQLKERDHADFH